MTHPYQKMRQIGRRGEINIEANRKLREIYFKKGIKSCEIGIDNKCTKRLFTAFAHRHRRYWYYNRPELLSDFNQTILACSHCHNQIDSNKELLKEVFQNLRGYEL